MTSFKRPLRLGALAGASVLALALAAPVMANDLAPSTGSTTTVPQTPDVGGGYRPDPTRKTVGEMERDIAEGKYDRSTAPQSSGDMNKLGEASSGQPVQSGTPIERGPAKPMGDMNSPGSGNSSGASSSTGYNGAFPSQAADLKVQRVRVQDLSPDLQAAVNSRMDRQQNPSELVETTILNRLALMGSEFKLDSAQQVGNNYVLRVSNPGGQEATLLYETNSDTLREVQM
jgi:hypothetical protein